MSSIPREKTLDSSLALLREGYLFILNRCDRYQSDIFETRLMFQKAICMMGEEAASVFYDADRFTRKHAMPPPVLVLLLDKDSVQVLDGEAHRHRKEMFMSLMSPVELRQLAELTADHWRAAIRKWERMEEVVLLSEVQEVLCRAVCEWAGIRLTEEEAKERTQDFAAMVDGAGTIGPRHWVGRLRRTRAEEWSRKLIDQVRAGQLEVAEGRAAHVIAFHRDLNGELLDTKVAAVELINVLRPTVAVSWFIMFAALALHDHPEYRQALQDSDDREVELFVQEVRRFYPMFPFIAGRVQQEFDWRRHHFEKGTRVLLDLYGTNHDPRIWEEPGAFRPERFRDWDGNPFSFIPQGGGDHYHNHRCAGEWITIELTKAAVRMLTTAMQYEVPEQDLRISLSRMPALPKSRFVIRNVKAIQ